MTTVQPTATTRERLLSEAARLFRSQGYAGTSTRALSESLGLTKGALYHHVQNKDALLLELCAESLTRIDHAVNVALDGVSDPLERLEAAVVAHVISALADADMHATMLIEMRSLTPEGQTLVRRSRTAYEARIRALVQDAQADGRLRGSIDAKWMTLSLLNTLNWSIFWYHPDGGLAPQEIGRTLLDVYLNGVVARPGDTAPITPRRTTAEPPQDDASRLDRIEAKLDALLGQHPV